MDRFRKAMKSGTISATTILFVLEIWSLRESPKFVLIFVLRFFMSGAKKPTTTSYLVHGVPGSSRRYGWFHLEVTCSTSCVGIVQNPLTSKSEILSVILAHPNKTRATAQKFVPTTMRLQRRFDRLPILISRTFLNSRLIYQVGNACELKGPADRP